MLGHLKECGAGPDAHKKRTIEKCQTRLSGDGRIEEEQDGQNRLCQHWDADDVRRTPHMLRLVGTEMRLVDKALQGVMNVLDEPNDTDHDASRHKVQLQDEPMPSPGHEAF